MAGFKGSVKPSKTFSIQCCQTNKDSVEKKEEVSDFVYPLF
jgi:hypothetical protein